MAAAGTAKDIPIPTEQEQMWCMLQSLLGKEFCENLTLFNFCKKTAIYLYFTQEPNIINIHIITGLDTSDIEEVLEKFRSIN